MTTHTYFPNSGYARPIKVIVTDDGRAVLYRRKITYDGSFVEVKDNTTRIVKGEPYETTPWITVRNVLEVLVGTHVEGGGNGSALLLRLRETNEYVCITDQRVFKFVLEGDLVYFHSNGTMCTRDGSGYRHYALKKMFDFPNDVMVYFLHGTQLDRIDSMTKYKGQVFTPQVHPVTLLKPEVTTFFPHDNHGRNLKVDWNTGARSIDVYRIKEDGIDDIETPCIRATSESGRPTKRSRDAVFDPDFTPMTQDMITRIKEGTTPYESTPCASFKDVVVVYDGKIPAHWGQKYHFRWEPGNTLFVRLPSNQYVYIGPGVYVLALPETEEVVYFYSPIDDNNDVPYPILCTRIMSEGKVEEEEEEPVSYRHYLLFEPRKCRFPYVVNKFPLADPWTDFDYDAVKGLPTVPADMLVERFC